MSDVFCYFLGAGASCNALPLVKDIPDRIDAFIKWMDDWFKRTGTPTKELSDAAKWLLEQTKRHATIDTFAKKLFLRNAQLELKRLKAVTSCFFVYEQTQHPVDYRYDTFLASIINFNMGRPVELPANIRILTWNYDTQLEKAFYSFCDSEKHVMDKITFNDNVKRLNGYCGTHPPGHLGAAYKATLGDSPYEGINTAVDLYQEYMKEFNSVPADIKFAWENDPDKFLYAIKKMLSDVTVLVLIGYSFPFFNRQIDRIILKNLTSINKIYVQVPEPYHAAIKERMHALRTDLPELILLRDTSSFYIPFDYP